MADPDLVGRTFVVTGANSGIGFATAKDLARRGGHVIMACRAVEKAEPARDAIREETGNNRVELVRLDLASFASVRAAAQEVLGRVDRIDVLLLNAGVGGVRGQTPDGFEMHFGVNHLGHFLLAGLLLDRVRRSAPARIVVVASEAHYGARGIDWEAVRRPTASFAGFREYGVSKLANVLFAAELGRRLAGTGVTTYAVHPGVVASNIFASRVPRPLMTIARLFMISNENGARTSLYCATSPAVGGETGLFYDRSAVRTP